MKKEKNLVSSCNKIYEISPLPEPVSLAYDPV